jgi:hypothetical protein
MLEAGGKLDLAQKTLWSESCCELRVKDLKGDGPVMLQVMRQVDRCHAPAAELTLEHVATGEAGLELIWEVRQCRTLLGKFGMLAGDDTAGQPATGWSDGASLSVVPLWNEP